MSNNQQSRAQPPLSTFKAACLLAVAWGTTVALAESGERSWGRGLGVGSFEAGAGRIGVAALPQHRNKRRNAQPPTADSTSPNKLTIKSSKSRSSKKAVNRLKLNQAQADAAKSSATAAANSARASAKVFAASASNATAKVAATTKKAKTSAAVDAAKTVTVTTLSGTAVAASTVTATSTATIISGSGTATSAAVSTSTAVPSGYSLPRPFDSTLGTNFTSTACPSFFATFLADPEFIDCTPFSLLLATSSAFFTAQQSPYSLLPYVMDASCKVNKTSCDSVMATYAQQIKAANTCGPDLTKRNPLVVQALAGFQNYDMMFKAGCLHNNVTDQYCFAEAAAQTTASELYFWYLPEGTGLPSGTVTSCESCTENLMSIYATYATNSTLLISQTYASARTLAAGDCGPTFAPLVAVTSAAGALSVPSVAWAVALGLIGWWTIA